MAAPIKKRERNEPKILIIGGGTAGLSTARALCQRGFKSVKILEASDRLGGRIWTTFVGSQVIEMGAEWIHGVLGNPIFDLACRTGLVDINAAPATPVVYACTTTGAKIPMRQVREANEAYAKFISSCAMYRRTRRRPDLRSVGEHVARDIRAYLASVADAPTLRALFDCFVRRENVIAGSSALTDVDLYEFGSYAELPGGNHTLPRGYRALVDELPRPVPPDAVELRCAARHISWQNRPDIVVTCEDGRRFTCDHVVVTVPLGVLQHQRHLFDPALPDRKRDAVNRLRYGVVDKVVLVFESPVQPTFLDCAVTNLVIACVDQPTTNGHADSAAFRLGGFRILNARMLQAWLTGDDAIKMESMSDDEVVDVCWRCLKSALNSAHFPRPAQCIRTAWHKNPLSRGSYTYIPVGATQADIRLVAESLVDDKTGMPLVLFAGEATHPSFYSTVHGAYQSGVDAAQTLIDLYLK